MCHSSTEARLPLCLVAAALVAATMPLTGGARALAADMPVKAAAPAAPAYQWTGCYAGLNGGFGASGTNFTTTVAPGTYLGAADAGEVDNDGGGGANGSNAIGGGQVGCNWQSKTIVIGIEGDYDYFHTSPSFFNNTDTLPVLGVPFVIGQQLTTDYFASVRPRLGIAAERNFAYLTGGVAFTKANYTESYVDSNTPSGVGIATGSGYLTGWTAGAGWEYAFADHWTLRFEYLYAKFPTVNGTGLIVGPGGSNALHGSSDLVMQLLRAGVSFKY